MTNIYNILIFFNVSAKPLDSFIWKGLLWDQNVFKDDNFFFKIGNSLGINVWKDP